MKLFRRDYIDAIHEMESWANEVLDEKIEWIEVIYPKTMAELQYYVGLANSGKVRRDENTSGFYYWEEEDEQ